MSSICFSIVDGIPIVVDRFENSNLADIVTPIRAKVLEKYLHLTGYDVEKNDYVIRGFEQGFDIGYRGPSQRQDTSNNIPITVGSKVELWNKVMKEVKLKRYAGPFKKIPFDNYMQSPIGLVPKDNGRQTCLIFHLSYEFKSGKGSLNRHTPEDLCKVKYRDLDHVVNNCLKLLDRLFGARVPIFFAKTDVRSAFRLVPLLPEQYCWLVMKAQDPESPIGEFCYFVDKCLLFGASRSCVIFQAFSDALAHILKTMAQEPNCLTNYLDDYLFIALMKMECDRLVKMFLEICDEIGCPIAEEKTEWGSNRIIFLGILLDGVNYMMAIPIEKRDKAVHLIKNMKDRKTVTVKDLQKLAGTLNFLCKAIFAGRTFIRRIYNRMMGNDRLLKQYHHVRVNADLKEDCNVWLSFLTSEDKQICRPFMDLNAFKMSETLNFYTDSSANSELGYGCVFNDRWIFGSWEPGFIKSMNQVLSTLN